MVGDQTTREIDMASRVSDGQILDATVRTVLAHGYAGATTREIAATAGINEVTLFRRFGDKGSLVRAAIAEQVGAFGQDGPAYTGDLRADVLRVLAFYQGVFRDRGRLLIMLLAEVPRRPDLVDVVGGPLVVIEELLDMIERYQRAGRLAAGPPLVVLTGLLGPLLMQSVAEQIRRAAGHRDIPASVSSEDLLERFLAGHHAAADQQRPDPGANHLLS